MPNLKLGGITALSESGGVVTLPAEVIGGTGLTTTSVNAANITAGVLPADVTGGSGLTSPLQKAGGTMTGTIAGFTSTGIDDNATSTSITIDSSGRVTKPAQPYAMVDFGGGGYVALSSGNLPFDAIVAQTGSNYNTSTYRFTCPVAGIYMVEMATIAQNATDTYELQACKNDVMVSRHHVTARNCNASTTIK